MRKTLLLSASFAVFSTAYAGTPVEKNPIDVISYDPGVADQNIRTVNPDNPKQHGILVSKGIPPKRYVSSYHTQNGQTVTVVLSEKDYILVKAHPEDYEITQKDGEAHMTRKASH